MAEPLAERSSTSAKLKQELNSLLLQVTAVSARLGAECTSTLSADDLTAAKDALQPIFDASNSLLFQESVEPDEALVYLRDTRLCELLLSLIRRLPWAAMRQNTAVEHFRGLWLLARMVHSMFIFLHAGERVRSSQRTAAYAEMSKRCLSADAHQAPVCMGSCQSGAAHEMFLLAAQQRRLSL